MKELLMIGLLLFAFSCGGGRQSASGESDGGSEAATEEVAMSEADTTQVEGASDAGDGTAESATDEEGGDDAMNGEATDASDDSSSQ